MAGSNCSEHCDPKPDKVKPKIILIKKRELAHGQLPLHDVQVKCPRSTPEMEGLDYDQSSAPLIHLQVWPLY